MYLNSCINNLFKNKKYQRNKEQIYVDTYTKYKFAIESLIFSDTPEELERIRKKLIKISKEDIDYTKCVFAYIRNLRESNIDLTGIQTSDSSQISLVIYSTVIENLLFRYPDNKFFKLSNKLLNTDIKDANSIKDLVDFIDEDLITLIPAEFRTVYILDCLFDMIREYIVLNLISFTMLTDDDYVERTLKLLRRFLLNTIVNTINVDKGVPNTSYVSDNTLVDLSDLGAELKTDIKNVKRRGYLKSNTIKFKEDIKCGITTHNKFKVCCLCRELVTERGLLINYIVLSNGIIYQGIEDCKKDSMHLRTIFIDKTGKENTDESISISVGVAILSLRELYLKRISSEKEDLINSAEIETISKEKVVSKNNDKEYITKTIMVCPYKRHSRNASKIADDDERNLAKSFGFTLDVGEEFIAPFSRRAMCVKEKEKEVEEPTEILEDVMPKPLTTSYFNKQ